MNEAIEDESDFNFVQASDRRSPNSENSNWNRLVVAALERASEVNPYSRDLPEGSVVPAIEAVNWSGTGDIRPRLWDKKSGRHRLIDSGSMITATMRAPEDKEDPSFKLIAVNGSPIKT